MRIEIRLPFRNGLPLILGLAFEKNGATYIGIGILVIKISKY